MAASTERRTPYAIATRLMQEVLDETPHEDEQVFLSAAQLRGLLIEAANQGAAEREHEISSHYTGEWIDGKWEVRG